MRNKQLIVHSFISLLNTFTGADLGQTLSCLGRLLDDDSPAIVKRVMMCATTLIQKTLEYMCDCHTPPTPPLTLFRSATQALSQATGALWRSTLEMSTRLLEFIDLDDNVTLSAQSFSFAQALVLAFTSPKLTNDHAFVQADKLKVEAIKIAERLAQKLSTQTYALCHANQAFAKPFGCYRTASGATALINLLSNIARQRAAILGELMVSKLIEFYHDVPPSISETQKKSILHTLKASLTTLQKNLPAGKLNDFITEELNRKGGVKRTFGELPPDASEEPDDQSPAAKRTKYDELPPEPEPLPASSSAIVNEMIATTGIQSVGPSTSFPLDPNFPFQLNWLCF